MTIWTDLIIVRTWDWTEFWSTNWFGFWFHFTFGIYCGIQMVGQYYICFATQKVTEDSFPSIRNLGANNIVRERVQSHNGYGGKSHLDWDLDGNQLVLTKSLVVDTIQDYACSLITKSIHWAWTILKEVRLPKMELQAM